MFPGDFDYDRNEAIAAAIQDPTLLGRRVFGMEEPGDVYEFIFSHRSRNVYAKINLQPNGDVIVYSAHRPLKGETL
jgi:hypothetical protein